MKQMPNPSSAFGGSPTDTPQFRPSQPQPSTVKPPPATTATTPAKKSASVSYAKFGIYSFMLLAASCWFTTTIATSGDVIKDWYIAAVVYGALNTVSALSMIGASMKPEMLARSIFKGKFTLAAFKALHLCIANAVFVGLLTFQADGFKRGYAPLPFEAPDASVTSGLSVPNATMIDPRERMDFGVQQYWSAWSIFAASFAVLMSVSDEITLSPVPMQACPGGVILFLSSLVALIGIIKPFKDDKDNTEEGLTLLIIIVVSSIPLMIHKEPTTTRPS